ncbi:MAG TPA: bifunctional transaldolase/phosoglucose isomerase [Chloroflexota bacterium]
MAENPLLKLNELGQSIWLDFFRRGMISSGELQRLIDEDGLNGITSNPAIFEKAILGSTDYDTDIRALALEGKDVPGIYEGLVVDDIRRAADLFRPTFDRLGGADGFVSLEVSPHLAQDTAGTIEEARRLWKEVSRPNLMIKVPGTPEGIPAIRQLTSEGINVNVTLLFGLGRYREAAMAYVEGLEELEKRGPIDGIASVASFFLSRIDVLLDPVLEKKAHEEGPDSTTARGLLGQVAIASAKIAYQIYQEIFGSDRFRRLASKGARPQRVLWASTGTKNPAYSDVKYVEPLIGRDTINTMPPETMNAYRDHGNPALRLEDDVDQARRALEQLPKLGIDLDAATLQLEEEGVEKFNKPFDAIAASLEQKRAAAMDVQVDREVLSLSSREVEVQKRLDDLDSSGFAVRIWRRDASLWKADPSSQAQIRDSLGWLTVADAMEECLAEMKSLSREVHEAGYRHVVHMGMGGSSLAPMVFQHTFGKIKGGLPLTVLDTTDPATILRIEKSVPLAETIFIVASKSGTTAEPNAFGEYFYGRVKEVKGERAGENFIAITDPGSALEKLAEQRHFRHTCLGFPDIGGRYSALSCFGLVPATLMGIDVDEFLGRALRMVHACDSSVRTDENPGAVLGAAVGELARSWQDKLTFVMPRSLATLGLWLEQLIAESTGKEGTGILPVAGEPLGRPAVYGDDRLFVHYRLGGEAVDTVDRGIAALEAAGHPVVTIQMDERMDLAQEFFRWEMATATAGAVLGINPFDQPNVQESKDVTNRLLASVRENGRLPEPDPALVDGALRLYSDDAAGTLAETLGRLFADFESGNYFAILAYLPEDHATDQAIESIRLKVRDRFRVASTAGYGPRYLHSTGQFHKGGPNTGIFLELTADDPADAPIPGEAYGFATFKRAQALGDLEALRGHGRRAIRVHLGADIPAGLAQLERAVDSAVGAKGART